MTDPQSEIQSGISNRLLELFQNLLPLVDSIADKLRAVLILGLAAVIWIGVWVFHFKKLSLSIGVIILLLSLIPVLILMRFWWALEELKNLPEIAGQMLGDAKHELRSSLQELASTKKLKIGFIGATKGLWSIGAMLSSVSDVMGSYLSVTTLMNPFMLILGAMAMVWTLVMIAGSLVLIAFT